MSKAFCNYFAVFIFVSLYALTYSKDPTCSECINTNTTLIIACQNVSNASISDSLCANSVSINCTLKMNCSEHQNPTSSSASVIPSSKSVFASSPSASYTYFTPQASATPSTMPPRTNPAPKPQNPGRRFDAASFIGGILLCGGIILLVYIAVRCYKSKPNYSRL